MRKPVAAVALTAGLAVGSILVAAANPMGLATAQSQPTTPPTSTQPRANGSDHHHGPLQQALDELVKNGTLTQAQADAVMSKMKQFASEHKGHLRGFGPRMFGPMQDVAGIIGIPPEQLFQELRSGKSLADIASAHGVDPKKLVDAIVKAATSRIDKAVQAGRIDQATADAWKKNLVSEITQMVNGTLPPMRFSRPWGRDFAGPHGYPGFGGPGQGTAPKGTAPKSTAPTTPPHTTAPPHTTVPSTTVPTTTVPSTTSPTTTAPTSTTTH